MLVLVDNTCYFKFIILALSEVMTELQIPHKIIENYFNEFVYNDNDIYLICTTHEKKPSMPKRYISYNFEQLIANRNWQLEVFKKFKKAELVFDYSLENIKVLKNYGINAHFLPLGYVNSMTYNKPTNNKIIDFTFIGQITEGRYNKLLPLLNIYKNKKNKLYICHEKCWADELETVYTHSKIGLNIHLLSGRTILEITRIILLISNKVIVLSERSNDKWYDNEYGNLINFFENDNYAIDCISLLEKYDYKEAERRYKELITKHRFIDYFKNIQPLILKLF
jgi:hypothetical protein